MFDGKIDFMDFNKIKINYGGRLTFRKIFKKKYLIFLIFSFSLLASLVVFYIIKNNQIAGVTMEIKELNEKQSQIDNSFDLLKSQNYEDELNLKKFKNEIVVIQDDVYKISAQEETTKKKNADIIKEKEKYEKQSATLSAQLKTETELKDVYNQRISSLSTLLDSLKMEYRKILEQKLEKEGKSTSDVENSKIINSNEKIMIQEYIKGVVGKKCFDGKESNFNPVIFHEKCDKSALVVLVKTDNNERIGAFTKVSLEGFEIKRDEDSVIFNLDKNKFYPLANKEYSTVVCDPNELPQFGPDLKIRSNGQGINDFPSMYGDRYKNEYQDMTKNKVFNIDILEIYKVDLY